MIVRTRGRPRGPAPLFAAYCSRLVAADFLSKARGVDLQADDEQCNQNIPLQWSDWRGHHSRTLPLTIEAVSQPFGGHRWWWICPQCHRRSGVLFLRDPDGPAACRACWPIRYLAAYPGRRWQHQLVDLMNANLDAPKTDPLLAPRRRGVRRGRHVLTRAFRRAARYEGEWTPLAAHVKAFAARRATKGGPG